MKIKRFLFGIAALAALLIHDGPAGAAELMLSTTEIRDPMMNNAVAARVALPQGWTITEQMVPWNLDLYGDPAHVVFQVQGPADEVEFTAVSRLRFNFDQGWLALQEYAFNEIARLNDQNCQMAWQFSPAYAQQLCAQINAETQARRQEMQQQKAALLSGQIAENGMNALPPMWAADLLQQLLRQNGELTGLQITKIERPADLEALLIKAVAEEDAKVRQMVDQLNMPVSFKGLSFDVARVHFSYTKGGKRYDEINLIITEYCTLVNMQQLPRILGQTSQDPMYGKEYVLWNARINGASALAGKLQAHEAMLTAIAANSAVDPLWQAAVDKVSADLTRRANEIKQQNNKAQMEMFDRERKHQQKMQQMRNESFDYVRKTQREVFARNSESLSNASTGWTDAITDRQRWQGSDNKYSAPNDYKYGWEGADGKVVLSNDSNFNPNNSSGYSGNWNEMQKVPW